MRTFFGWVGWVGACALVAARPAVSFDTDLHPVITTEALSSLGFDPSALAAINQANVDTDRTFNLFILPAAHFDNEAFAAGSARLRGKLDEILEALRGCKRDTALAAIG